MEQLENFDMPDIQALVCVLIMVLVTIGISALFTSFIESKPSGRQTVIGKFEQICPVIIVAIFKRRLIWQLRTC